MATKKENPRKSEEQKKDSLWRKPITLIDDDVEDPLATLYRGREDTTVLTATSLRTPEEESADTISVDNRSTISEFAKTPTQNVSPTVKRKSENQKVKTAEVPTIEKPESITKLSDSELKAIFKIKNEKFEFTDIREILRGKSLDMYAYLHVLASETGICKIKHVDLMRQLDISRPTLFKQGDWLIRLSLIEKRNVPGDHLGTSYTVYPFEEILPVSAELIKQLNSFIKEFKDAIK